ncbi:MAG: hypothetical protein ABW171_07590 [Steroidobacter sp.]
MAVVPRGINTLIEHLIDTPADRALIRNDPEVLFDRFEIPAEVRETLRSGGRDDLYRLGIHPNFVIKWLIWSGRPTMPFFPIDYYFARR